LPGASAWGPLAEAEGRRLGDAGLISGLGMSAVPDGIDAFIEGMRWQKTSENADHRQPFKRQWHLRWVAGAQPWHAGSEWLLDVDVLAENAGLESADGVKLHLELAPGGAPRLHVVRWLDGLEKSGPAGLKDMAKMACKPHAAGSAPLVAEHPVMDEVAGKPRRQARILMPLDWQGGQPKSRADVRRLALIVRFQVSGAGQPVGDALLREAAAVFVFGPDV
jgi:hypothetical protein